MAQRLFLLMSLVKARNARGRCCATAAILSRGAPSEEPVKAGVLPTAEVTQVSASTCRRCTMQLGRIGGVFHVSASKDPKPGNWGGGGGAFSAVLRGAGCNHQPAPFGSRDFAVWFCFQR